MKKSQGIWKKPGMRLRGNSKAEGNADYKSIGKGNSQRVAGTIEREFWTKVNRNRSIDAAKELINHFWQAELAAQSSISAT